MSSKCPGCGFYTLACQCKKDDNYCGKFPDERGEGHGCDRVISDCKCDHNDHYTYGPADDHSDGGNCNYNGSDGNISAGGNSDNDADD